MDFWMKVYCNCGKVYRARARWNKQGAVLPLIEDKPRKCRGHPYSTIFDDDLADEITRRYDRKNIAEEVRPMAKKLSKKKGKEAKKKEYYKGKEVKAK